MSFPRVTFFLSDGLFAWTETYYSAIDQQDLPTLMTQAVTLGQKRTMLCANWEGSDPNKLGVSLDEIRVSMDDTWRDALVEKGLRRGGNKANYQAAADFSSRPERAYSCVLLRCEGIQDGAVGLYRKNIYLSGIPETVINDPSGPNPANPPAFQRAWRAFRQELINVPTKWGFKVRSKGIVAQEHGIAAVTFNFQAGTSQISVPNTNYVDHDPQTGDQQYFLIRGCQFKPKQRGPNGMHPFRNDGKAPDPNPNNYQLYTILDASGSGTYLGHGKVRGLVYAVIPFQDIQMDSETHRKRGVRTGRPVGRLKKQTFVGS